MVVSANDVKISNACEEVVEIDTWRSWKAQNWSDFSFSWRIKEKGKMGKRKYGQKQKQK